MDLAHFISRVLRKSLLGREMAVWGEVGVMCGWAGGGDVVKGTHTLQKNELARTHTHSCNPLCNLATLHIPTNTHVQPGINNLTEAGRHNWAGLRYPGPALAKLSSANRGKVWQSKTLFRRMTLWIYTLRMNKHNSAATQYWASTVGRKGGRNKTYFPPLFTCNSRGETNTATACVSIACRDDWRSPNSFPYSVHTVVQMLKVTLWLQGHQHYITCKFRCILMKLSSWIKATSDHIQTMTGLTYCSILVSP